MAKTIKKILAVILIAVICVCACSCTITGKVTISASGNVIQYAKTFVEKAKIDNIKARLKDKTDTVFETEAEDEQILTYIEGMLVDFKEETVDDVTYLYKEQTDELTLRELNEGLDSYESNVAARVTTKDMWVYNPDMTPSTSSELTDMQELAEIFEKLGLELKVSSEIKFPYVITKTNCEKVDDYTVIEPTDKPIYYVITEASEDEWTKKEDTQEAVKEQGLKELQPLSPGFVKVAYASKKAFEITFDIETTYALLSDKLELQVQVNGGEWKTHDVYDTTTFLYSSIYYNFKEGKTYRFRARNIRQSATGAFDDMYSPYEYSSKKQAAYLSNCPYVKATSPKKGQLKVAFTKKQKVQVWGYRIRYSTDKKFKKGVKAVEVSASKMPKTIKGLKSGKTYYVQVRKYVKDTDGDKIYGTNCKAKKVRIK